MYDLTLDLCQVGKSDRFRDGWVHEKICPFTVIVQPVAGAYEVETPAASATIDAGEVFVVASDTAMTITHRHRKGRMAAQWLHARWLAYGALDVSACLAFPLKVTGGPAKAIGAKLSMLLALEDETGLHASIRSHELCFGVLSELCSLARADRDLLRAVEQSPAVKRALAFIHDNLHQPLQVADAAKAAGLSLSRFHEVFKQAVRCAPKQYIRRSKLTAACRMLSASTRPIAQIAEALGFTSPFNFSRDFKRRYSVSPRAYRREHTNLQI